ncbi:MAG: hypothetical protein A4E31_01350 [Methanomassiliicoccales archaeon PtaU1.Bin030]|nr:MAG: hypothetical protein A4E31_01350 [Methanomassiliicoccales archaeon PtaU1.Bin030]
MTMNKPMTLLSPSRTVRKRDAMEPLTELP